MFFVLNIIYNKLTICLSFFSSLIYNSKYIFGLHLFFEYLDVPAEYYLEEPYAVIKKISMCLTFIKNISNIQDLLKRKKTKP